MSQSTPKLEVDVSLHESARGEVAVMTLRGKLLGGDPSLWLRNELDPLIARGVGLFIADLVEYEIVCATGLTALVQAAMAVRDAGGRMVLVNLSESAEKLLQISRLEELFDIYDTVDEALKSFEAG